MRSSTPEIISSIEKEEFQCFSISSGGIESTASFGHLLTRAKVVFSRSIVLCSTVYMSYNTVYIHLRSQHLPSLVLYTMPAKIGNSAGRGN